MRVRFRVPPSPPSPLRRLDPRWRLAGLILALAAVAVVSTPPGAGVALLGALLLAWLARLPLRWYLGNLAALAGFLALVVLPLPLLVPGGWGAGLTVAALLAGKAVAAFTVVLVLLASGPLDATLKAARSLRAPGLLVQLALLTYRYLFVLTDELDRLRVALRVRGFRNRANRHSYRVVGAVAGTLLVRGHERAERVAQAMRCRGFDGTFRALAEFRTTARDVLAFLVLAGAAAGAVALDRLFFA
jgi:cobalt/nickel transport system permease protein